MLRGLLMTSYYSENDRIFLVSFWEVTSHSLKNDRADCSRDTILGMFLWGLYFHRHSQNLTKIHAHQNKCQRLHSGISELLPFDLKSPWVIENKPGNQTGSVLDFQKNKQPRNGGSTVTEAICEDECVTVLGSPIPGHVSPSQAKSTCSPVDRVEWPHGQLRGREAEHWTQGDQSGWAPRFARGLRPNPWRTPTWADSGRPPDMAWW